MRELEKIEEELRDITNRITSIQKRLDREGYTPRYPRRSVMEIITALLGINDKVELEKIYASCEKEGLTKGVVDKNLEGLKGLGEIFEPREGYISKC